MAHRIASLILLFAAVCRATVNLTEQQLIVCQGHDAQLANCSTVGTGGLVWLFSGQADVRFQPSTNPTIGTTLERMNQGSNGSVFSFTLDVFDNETDTYRSTANVSNIQLSDNATSITCAEPTPQNPISIVVIVLEVCPSPSSTIIPAITSTLVVPDRLTTTDSLFLSSVVSNTLTSPTVSPVPVGGVSAVVIAVPIGLILLLVVVIATVVGVVLLIVYCRRREYVKNVALDGDDEIHVEVGAVKYIAAVNPVVQVQIDDDIKSVDAKNDDTKASTVQSNDNLENGNRIGEEDQNEKNEKDDSDGTSSEDEDYLDSNDKTPAELLEEKVGHHVLTRFMDEDNF